MKYLAYALILVGVLWAMNGLLAGPEAFGFGTVAVIAIVLSGVLLVAAGLSLLRSSKGKHL